MNRRKKNVKIQEVFIKVSFLKAFITVYNYIKTKRSHAPGGRALLTDIWPDLVLHNVLKALRQAQCEMMGRKQTRPTATCSKTHYSHKENH